MSRSSFKFKPGRKHKMLGEEYKERKLKIEYEKIPYSIRIPFTEWKKLTYGK